MTTFPSMNEKGQSDVAGELWINAVRESLFKAMDEERLMSGVKGSFIQLGEGWWIPPHTAEKHPEIVNDVNPLLSGPDLFSHPEDPSKEAFVGCAAGWGCQLSNANLFRAFDMESTGWRLFDPGSATGIDGSMAKAAERGENWLGYYWFPTALIGKYGMVPVSMGESGRPENWDGCIVKPEQECAAPKAYSWIVLVLWRVFAFRVHAATKTALIPDCARSMRP